MTNRRFEWEYDTIGYEKLVLRTSNKDTQTIPDKTAHYTLSFARNL